MPGFDPISLGIGAGVSLLGDVASGITDIVNANKQKQQAASERAQANALTKAPIRPEFLQKLNADQLAALSNMPGFESVKDMLAQNTSNAVQNARTVAPDAASASAMTSAAVGQQNKSTLQLGVQNADFRTKANETVSNDFWNIGLQQHGLERERDAKQQLMLQQAANLENASMANQAAGINTIGGGAGAVATHVAGDIQTGLTNDNNLKIAQALGSNTSTTGSNPALGIGNSVPSANFWGTGATNTTGNAAGTGMSQIQAYINTLPPDQKAAFLKSIWGQ